MQFMQHKFNDVDIIQKIQVDGSMPDFRIMNPLLLELINEGIKYMNRFSDKKRKFINDEMVGWIVAEVGWNAAFVKIAESLKLCMPEAGFNSKNETATQSENP
jgi:hypothetical protein